MAKPRRKHPSICTMEESPQGAYCVALLNGVVGDEIFSYRALETLKDGTHIFVVGGRRGRGILVERKGKAVGNEWLCRFGVIAEQFHSPVVWHMDLAVWRWDPWLHAEATGDSTVRDSKPAERRRVSAALREDTGRRKDRLVTRVLPVDVIPRRVAGLPRGLIDEILARHGLLDDGFAGSVPRGEDARC
jgi:hypothetical protein